MPAPTKRSYSRVNRRNILRGLGIAGAVGVAGCLGDDPDDTDDSDDSTTTPVETPTPDPTEIKHGGTLRVAVAENINSFDPPYSNDTTSSLGQSFLYESMITTDAEGNVYPWLAKSWEVGQTNDVSAIDYEEVMVPKPVVRPDDEDEAPYIDTDDQIIIRHPDNDLENDDEALVLTVNESQDAVDAGIFGMQFIYELHEGIEFHNGEELTAENVVRSYERYENSMVAAQTFDDFLHAQADGDYTVELYANFPDAEAYRSLTTSVLPLEHIDLPPSGLDPREDVTPVGTGPYVFEEFEDASHYVVRKNDNYWLDNLGLDALEWWDGPEDFPSSPVIDEIDMELIPSDSTRAAAVLNDEVDLTYGLSTDTLDDFEESDDYQVRFTETGGYTFMQFPMQVEPWDDEQLRNGVNHLIPREIIANDIFGGWQTPAWTPLPSLAHGAGTVDHDALEEELRPRNEYDPELGVSLIEEAIDRLGLETPIEIQIETNADNDDRVRMIELIAESMNSTDLFDVSVETHEWLAYLGRILSPDYPDRGHLMVVGLSGTFDPGSFCEANHHSRNVGACCNINATHWDDLDQLMDEAAWGMDVLDDPQLRAEKYDDIWDIITDRDGTVYTVIGITEAVMNTDVRGFEAYPFPEGLLSYALHAPHAGAVTWLDRDE